MCSLDHPPASAIAGQRLSLGLFLATRFDMDRIAPLPQRLAHRRVVVTLVSAQMLPGLWSWLRTFHRHAFQRGLDQSHVVRVGPLHRQPDRDSRAIGQDGPLGSRFAAVGRVSPRVFPRPQKNVPEEPWSCSRRDFAIPSRSPEAVRTPATHAATTRRRSPIQPVVESIGAGCSPNRIPAVRPSTDNRSAGHKISRRARAAIPAACGQGSSCDASAPGAGPGSAPTSLPASATQDQLLSPLCPSLD